MKAIFAVSALAAAIAAAPAFAADTEATTKFKGAMDAQFVLDMAAEPDATYDVNMKEDDFNYGISVEWSVKNGPFSGSIGLKKDESKAAVITVGDLIVTDGKLSFGQVGKLMSTDEYAGEMKEAGRLTTDVGFRYKVSDEFTVQLQGEQNDVATKTGVAAQYKATAGALSYVVEAEAEASAKAPDNFEMPFFAGAGVTYKDGDTEVKAGLNVTQANTPGSEAVTEYAIAAKTKVAGLSLSASWTDVNVDVEKDEILKAEVSYTIDAITPSAGYTFTTAEKAGDELWGKVAYKQDNLEASVKAMLKNFDADEADDVLIETRLSTKSAVGVTYYAEHNFGGKDEHNKLALGAKYSF